ncbi:hypothetical protein SAMN02745150_00497 [Brevinema andersonii]|uniref:Lipoprotein n=1 Tax=Brevinema andersonii TaxID=34097 RepID=A0A1I1DG07_BREAD|nr:hypothetical protein [Brevinema andersonii]SFB73774.1 hypothetical protein SAMN02745150_00497 [Brevinema andersonii]
MAHIRKIVFLCFCVAIAACTTQKADSPEAVMFKSLPTPQVNPYTENFLTNIQGTYKSKVLDEMISIAEDGSFKVGDISYILHSATADYRAIYKAETPLPEYNRSMVTYHGLILSGNQLLSAGLKDPDYSKVRQFSSDETKYSWELNMYRIENIDWDIEKAAIFAIRQ